MSRWEIGETVMAASAFRWRLRVPGAQLMVVCLPRERNLKFRLGILAMICHLDYTDETHPNSISEFLLRAVPYVVTGPHYHSLPLNRRFFRGITAPQTLHDSHGQGRVVVDTAQNSSQWIRRT
jgi:hypothetical protein